METTDQIKKSSSHLPVAGIAIAIIAIAAVAGYFIYNKTAEVAPDYNRYLDYVNQGDSLVKVSKFAAAKVSYNKSLTYNPRDSAASKKINKLDSADQLVKTQNFAEAKKMFELVVNIPPSRGLSAFALSKAAAGGYPPIKISIKWRGDSLQITISGGLPFTDASRPYTIDGIECVGCVQWRKETDNYVANVAGTKVNTNKLKLRDQTGQYASGAVPERPAYAATSGGTKTNTNSIKQAADPAAAPAKNSFSEHVKTGDSLFSLAKYTDAKAEYAIALGTHPDDNAIKKKIQACDDKLNVQKMAEAKNIPRIHIKPGGFTMGTDNGNAEDGPAHEVTIKPFSLGKTEVTVAQYRNFCALTGRQMPPAPPYGWNEDNPITNVTWEEARAYCTWVGGRLPTEAEWEYAAGAGGKTTYSGSNSIDRVAVYKANSGGRPASVGKKGSNGFNLADMTGNVSEWCADWFGRKYYAQSDAANPLGPASGSEKAIRGGAYNSVANSTQDGDQLRVSYRNSEEPSARQPYIGFRVAWNN